MVQACRICKGRDLEGFLNLGEQPHCNSFVRACDLDAAEMRWPLELLYCRDCHLVQLSCVVDADLMFRNYPYVSGTTNTLSAHFYASARNLAARFAPPARALVVDIGSNDGSFLRGFTPLGLRTLGVDPARNVAEMANREGIETINDYFGETLARRIRAERGSAFFITAAGVFFHIDDIDDVCRGVYELLDERGVFHIQAIYLGAMLEQTSFDNVYHEHLSYYTLRSVMHLLQRFELTVFDVGLSPIHGGSLMVYACRQDAYPMADSVQSLLAYEHVKNWDTPAPYREFAGRAQRVRDELLALLRSLKAGGKRIAAYGAPAKGNTLLNYGQIGSDLVEYAAERAPLKVGLFTPGMHIPVVAESEAMTNPPDYFLLLPWNFADELLTRNRAYRERGGKFIIPIPSPSVV